jgi:HEPN domain-containing protein
MSEHRAWLRQAQKDRESAERVLDLKDGSTFCQAIAKSQQAVEKAVKALAAALIENRIIGGKIPFVHSVEPFMVTSQ